MRFAWMPEFRWVCERCHEIVPVRRLVRRAQSACGFETELPPAAWLWVENGAVENDAGKLPCPTCGKDVELQVKSLKALACRHCGNAVATRGPNAEESFLAAGIEGVVAVPSVGDVFLVNPETVQRKWRKLRDASAAVAEAESASTATERLDEIAAGDNAVMREAAASNEGLGDAALAKLAVDRNDLVRTAVAKRRMYLKPELLVQLARDESPRVRLAVARNDAAPADALAILAGDSEERIRRAAAANFMLPIEAQERLAGDASVEVRTALARRWSLSFTAAEMLAQDPADVVRMAREAGAAESREVSARHAPPSMEEVGATSEEEYNRIMTEAYRH